MDPDDAQGWLSPQQYFKLSGVRPRKRYGQNFLAQPRTARKIIDCAELDGSETVLEVGPGLGALTRHLLSLARRLILVEVDRDLADYLKDRVAGHEPPVDLRVEDILQASFPEIAAKYGAQLVLLGNLPYNISSPLLFKMLESAAVIRRAVFMLQLEVAERLVAAPGSKQYGVLSVLLNSFATTRLLLRLGPKQFYPPPRVDSAVLSVEFPARRESSLPSFEVLRRLVTVAFSKRRKTLRNCLAGLDPEDPGRAVKILEQLGIDPQRRPETLTVDEYIAVAAALEAARS